MDHVLAPPHVPLLLLALAAVTTAQQHTFIPVDDDPDGDLPVEVEFTLDGSRVLVLHHHSDDLTFVDPTTQAITDVVPVGRTGMKEPN